MITRDANPLLLLSPEKNNLSFIETSALDSTNVEEAFKNILTGRPCRTRYHDAVPRTIFMLRNVRVNTGLVVRPAAAVIRVYVRPLKRSSLVREV